ncbi:MAG TPA: phosphohistidine phosphatase SixA [bacterium]|nr:phosphohistidine phosphatase SixA [bacterium]
MKLFLLRHGQAAHAEQDSLRSLTTQGKDEVRRIGEHLRNQGIQVAAAWHSPKTRAVETARIFLEASGGADAAQAERDDLKPEGDVESVLRDLASFAGESLVLVTHLPFVADLAQALDPAADAMTFPTAGLAAFEKRGGNWKWLWSLDPKALP